MDNNQDLLKFLEKIGMIESSGGKFTKHALIKSGIQKGTRAVGTYGLMPNTIKELIEKNKQKGTANEQDLFLDQLNIPQLYAYTSSRPEVQEKYAQQLAAHVLEKAGGDQEKAAYLWNMGHNLNPEKITDKQLNSSDYVKKFRKLQPQQNRTVSSTPSEKSSYPSDIHELFDFAIMHNSDPSFLFDPQKDQQPQKLNKP